LIWDNACVIQCPECERDIYLDTGLRPFAAFLRHRAGVMAAHCAEYPNEHPILTQRLVDELLDRL
jgi:hypothetical protein